MKRIFTLFLTFVLIFSFVGNSFAEDEKSSSIVFDNPSTKYNSEDSSAPRDYDEKSMFSNHQMVGHISTIMVREQKYGLSYYTTPEAKIHRSLVKFIS